MRACSNAFKAAVVTSHTAVCRCDVLRDGRVIQQLAVHDGTVTADRTAAQLRNFNVSVSDPTGTLTPQGMQSLLTPFGTYLQLWKGVRLQNVQTLVALYGTQASWTTVSSFGAMVGVVGDPSSGALRLGP